MKYVNTDKTKTFKIVCKGKIISKHIDFYHAQINIPILFKQDRLENINI